MNLDEYDVCDACIKGKQGQKCFVSKKASVNLWRRLLGKLICKNLVRGLPCSKLEEYDIFDSCNKVNQYHKCLVS